MPAVRGVESLGGASEHWAGPRARFGWQALAALLAPVLSNTPSELSLVSAFLESSCHCLESVTQGWCVQLTHLCVIRPCYQTAFAHRPHLIPAGHSFQIHTSLPCTWNQCLPVTFHGSQLQDTWGGWCGFTGGGEKNN